MQEYILLLEFFLFFVLFHFSLILFILIGYRLLTLSRYTKTIAGVGVAAQKYNPEMKAPDTDDTAVMALDEKLQKMGRVSLITCQFE